MGKLNLKDYQYTMDSCNHCGQCKWIPPHRSNGWDFAYACPLYQHYGFDAYSGQGLINIAKEIMNGTLSYEDGLENMIYSCTCCGACDINCKSVRDMEILETILALRENCCENGKLPDAHRETAEKLSDTCNIYGMPHEERFAWLPSDFEDDKDADTLLFLGCAAAYRYNDIALSAIKVLRAGGVKFKLLWEEEWCCGADLWRTGQSDAFERFVRHNIDVFHKHGIKTIITACAECFGTFRGAYPRYFDIPFEVKHISQVAAELIHEQELLLHDPKLGSRVTYHDPCMLGRLSEWYIPWEGKILPYGLHEPSKEWRRGEHGVYEEPRSVIQAIPGLTMVEMVRHHEASFCCGSHADSVNPEFAAWTAGERIREAKASGADIMVSTCPFCRDMFTDKPDDELTYYDITVLLANAL